MVTDLILMRHGQIEANVQKLWHGTTDGQLTATGQQQLAEVKRSDLSKYPSITKIYSSPLMRTMKTASALGHQFGLAPIAEHALIEFGIGDYEGFSYENLRQDHDFFRKMGEDYDFSAPNGESLRQVQRRMQAAFNRLIDMHRGECIAFVGHGAAFGILMATLLTGNPWPFHEYHLSNTGIAHLRIGDEVELISFDDMEHLSGL